MTLNININSKDLYALARQMSDDACSLRNLDYNISRIKYIINAIEVRDNYIFKSPKVEISASTVVPNGMHKTMN